ncbi:hypothetical protein V1512DRAFT_259180 [Lipomyces arxii]|uniref:uncharacterized protein n=1 Tax=Lipomyces arxii TaxID=56418 RepID=UPI0034CFBE5B
MSKIFDGTDEPTEQCHLNSNPSPRPTVSTEQNSMSANMNAQSLPPPVPRLHPKRKPLPQRATQKPNVTSLSTLSSSRFPTGSASPVISGGPPSPVLYVQPAIPSTPSSAPAKVQPLYSPQDLLSTARTSEVSDRASELSHDSEDGRGVLQQAASMLAQSPVPLPPPSSVTQSQRPLSVSSDVSFGRPVGDSRHSVSSISTTSSSTMARTPGAATPKQRTASCASSRTMSSIATAAYLTTVDSAVDGGSDRPSGDTMSEYVMYLRRQKATVWSDRSPKRAVTIHVRQGTHKDKKKAKEDEYAQYTHAYAYYHPKLDMTLELSDARAVDSTKPGRLAAREFDSDGNPVGLAEPVEPVEPVLFASSVSTPSESVNTAPSRHDSVASVATSSTKSDIKAVTAPASDVSRSTSVGSVDDSVMSFRRTLYIVNPDYSGSSDDEQ